MSLYYKKDQILHNPEWLWAPADKWLYLRNKTMSLSDSPEYRTWQDYQMYPKRILPPNCYDGKGVGM